MSITIDDELAEAALRAAAKAGSSSVVEGLIRAGVNANSMFGAALVLAERYGDAKTIELLRRETSSGPLSEPSRSLMKRRFFKRKKNHENK